jgi:Flp pilus assembly protein protease CpaA
MSQTVLLPLVILWLLVCMIHDLRSRQVPDKLTLYPLIAAGLYGLVQGQWMPVLLLPMLIIVSDWEPRGKRLLFAGVASAFAAILDERKVVLVVALFTIWLLWEMSAMGGADAKLLMVITLVTGNPWVLALIALAGGVQGLFGLLTRKRSVPYVVAIFAGTLLYAVSVWWVQTI